MSTVRTNAILDASGGNTATINGIALRQGVLDPENRIINGSFDFWQRGTSHSAAGYGSADRWAINAVGGTFSLSRSALTVGTNIGTSTPAYQAVISVSGQTLTNHAMTIQQKLEGVSTYSGQTITVLGWVRRTSGTGNMAVSVDQVFGTGGSPSSSVLGNGQVVTVTTSYAPFAVTFAVPSITGKTLGTNGDDSLNIVFWTSAGSSFNARSGSLGLQTCDIALWGVHIKLGTHTTSATDLYKQPELGPELLRCHRYFQSIGGDTLFQRVGLGQAISSTQCYVTVPLATVMRIAPSVSTSGAFAVSSNVGGVVSVSTVVMDGPSRSFPNLLVTASTASLTSGNATHLFTNNSTASRISFDAEL